MLAPILPMRFKAMLWYQAGLRKQQGGQGGF
jgi:hypothetical protein